MNSHAEDSLISGPRNSYQGIQEANQSNSIKHKNASFYTETDFVVKTTFWETYFNLNKILIGLGIQVISYAMSQVGFILGLCIVFFNAIVVFYSQVTQITITR